MAKKPDKHRGIPRSLSEAEALGYRTTRVNLDAVDNDFIPFTAVRARSGSFCGFAPNSDPAYWDVCYKGANGKCIWKKVPRVMGHG